MITCTRPGDGANAIVSGGVAPSITITAKVQTDTPAGEQTVHAGVATAGDTDASNNTDTANFEIVATERPVDPENPEVPNTGLQAVNIAAGVVAGIILLITLIAVTRKHLLRR